MSSSEELCLRSVSEATVSEAHSMSNAAMKACMTALDLLTHQLRASINESLHKDKNSWPWLAVVELRVGVVGNLTRHPMRFYCPQTFLS